LEAWVHGRPVIVGDTPAQREIVESGLTGILVPYRDESSLLAALVGLARDPELRVRMGAAGRARVLQRHTVDRMIEQIWQVLTEAASS
jgi:glycosyltransferase involved in cell wall biosynthesis